MASIATTADGRLSLSWQWIARALSWPVAAIAVIAHTSGGHPGFSSQALLCAGLIGALTVLAIGYVRPRELPVIQLILLRIYLAMGFPVFFAPRMHTALGSLRLSSRALDLATLGALAFTCSVVITALLVRRGARRIGRDVSKFLDRQGEYDGRDTIAARILAAVSIAIYLIIASSPGGQKVFGSFGYVATLLGGPAISLGLLFWDMEQRGNYVSRLLFWLALLLLTLAGLSTGMLGAALEPGIDTVIFLWAVRGRLPILMVVGAVVVLIGLNQAKHVYRSLSWRATQSVSLLQRAENWTIAVQQTYSGNASMAIEASADSATSRLSTLLAVAQIFEWVPARFSHAGAKAWLEMPLQYVPRLLWPEKPSPVKEFNNRYTTTFQLQTYRGTQGATFNLPSVGDGYWRLGWLGIFLEGIFLGLLAGLYGGMATPSSRALIILGTGFLFSTGPECYVLNVLGSQPQYWIAMAAILLLAQNLPALFSGAPKTKLVRERPRAPLRVFK
ncbi:MAG: hypothetical protein RLZZ450_1127 [Pseudomonadota bacterium]|jgi:hypothetical protein